MRIAYLPGDGIGPEVMTQARRAVDAVCEKENISIEWRDFPQGSDHYIKTKELLPESTLKELASNDALLFGAIGDPRVSESVLLQGILLKLRFALDLFINLRPMKRYPGVSSKVIGSENVDMMVVRETTEDFYTPVGGLIEGAKAGVDSSIHKVFKEHDPSQTTEITITARRKEKDDDLSLQAGILSGRGTRRVMKYAFELAKEREKHVTNVTKSNAIPMYRFWDSCFNKEAAKNPDVQVDRGYVDAIAQFFIVDPCRYDVLVAPNMFGDILTDLGAAVVGGMGVAPSAIINAETGFAMFEPIHGSAPDIAGKGIANPVAGILSAAMMLNHLKQKAAAKCIEDAVESVLRDGKIMTRDLGGSANTAQFGDAVLEKIRN